MNSSVEPHGGARPSRTGAKRIAQIIVFILLALVVAAALVATAAVTNPSSSFPITVDGATTPTEYGSKTSSLGYTSGSLYSDPGTNLATYVVTDKLTGQKGSWFCGKIESTVISANNYVAPENVGRIDLSVNRILSKTVTLLEKAQLIIGTSQAGFTYTVQTTDANGNVTVSSPADFGILISTAMTTGNGDNSFPGMPALVTEFAIPLAAARTTLYPTTYPADGNAYRIVSTYYDPTIGNKAFQITDGVVSVAPGTAKRGPAWQVTNDAFFVPHHVDIAIGNIGSLDPGKNGTVKIDVTIPATMSVTDAQVAAALAAGTISTRDYTRDPGAEAALDFLSSGVNGYYSAGAHPVQYTLQANADGSQDLALFFKVPDLTNQSDPFYWGPDTRNVELAASIGTTNFGSKTQITISSQ